MEAEKLLLKHKNKILNLGLIILAVYFGLTIYRKQTAEWKNLLATKEIEIKKNEVLDNIGQLKSKFEEYKNYVNKKDIASLISMINNIAVASSVKVVSIRPIPETDSSFYIRYPFELLVEVEKYHDLGKFISALESDPNIFYVESLIITPHSNPEGEKKFYLTVNLVIGTVLLKN